MTLKISCRLTYPYHNEIIEEEIATLTEGEVRYFGFDGAFDFMIEELDLGEAWEDSSVLNLSSLLVNVSESLERGTGRLSIEVPESTDQINFRNLIGGYVEVTANYEVGRATTSLEEFKSTAWRFAREAYLLCLSASPNLSRNRNIELWYPSPSSAQRFFAELRAEGLIPERKS